MNIAITERVLLPVRRDKQTGASFTSGGGGGGGGSAASMGSGGVAITAAELLAKLLTVDGTTSLLDADLLDGNHGSYYQPALITSTPGNRFTQFSFIAGDGVMEVGKFIDFHESAVGVTDYDLRLTSDGGILFVSGGIKGESLESITAFSAGFAGDGYKIIETGGVSSLEVDQLTIRGTLKAYELQINKISSVNGGIIISIANAKCTTVSGTTIYFDEGIGLTIPFVVDDYIKAQQFTGTGIAVYLGKVTAINAGNIVATTISGTPWNGMDLVQFGNSNTGTYPERQSAIYLTAAETNNPYIAGYSGITDGLLAGHEKFRLGNLVGITDANFGALSGYGLYSQNVYLSGNINISGVGTFGTSIGGAGSNMTIMGASISDSAYAGDGGTIYINYEGYLGGSTYFRNFVVGNGKGNNGLLINAIGNPKRVGICTNISPDSTFQVATLNGAGLKINYNEGGTNYLYGAITFDSIITANAGIDMGGSPIPICVPKMTTTVRDNLASVTSGMIIYNTSLGEFQVIRQDVWKNMVVS